MSASFRTVMLSTFRACMNIIQLFFTSPEQYTAVDGGVRWAPGCILIIARYAAVTSI